MIPSPKIENALKSYISRNEAQYATRRNQVYSQYLSAGNTNFLYPNIFSSSTLPDQVLMVMVNSDAKNGSLTKNPYYFQHFNASNVTLQVNQRNLPRDGLKQDFDRNLYMETYRELFDNLGFGNSNVAIPLTPLKFKHGNCIFAWDLNHDRCAGMHNNHSRMKGAVTLKIDFKEALTENITIMVFGIYRDYIKVDKEGKPNTNVSYGVDADAYPTNAFAPAA